MADSVLGVSHARPGTPFAGPQGTNNRCLVDALDAFTRRGREARGIAAVDRAFTQDQLSLLHNAGVRGLRVNPESFGQHDPGVARSQLLAARSVAHAMGWHVQVYSNLQVIAGLADDIAALPVPLVVDHYALADAALGTGQPGMAEALSLVRQGKLYVKLSAPYRILKRSGAAAGGEIARAFIDARLDRMLWGTDWPHTGAWPGLPRSIDVPEPFHPIDDGLQLDLFDQWVSTAERQAILVDNPASLYGFARRG